MNIGDLVKIKKPNRDAGRIGEIVRFDFFDDGNPKGIEIKFPIGNNVIVPTKMILEVN